MCRKFFLLLSFLVPFLLQAQIPNGTWRDHLAYAEARRLAAMPGKIYCSTAAGSLFYLRTEDNSLQKISKVTGLSDAGVSTVGYSETEHMLVIGYSNGNIDLVRNDTVYNVPDIKLKSMVGDKTIRTFYFNGKDAFLACGFGMVQLDLQKREIRDTYLFGDGGTQISVNDITSDGSNLYAGTAEGIYKADMNNPNLVDYNAWVKIMGIPDPDAFCKNVAWHAGKLYALCHTSNASVDEIVVVTGNTGQLWPGSEPVTYGYMGEVEGTLIACAGDHTNLYDQNDNLIRREFTYYAEQAMPDKDGNLWYAEPISGLLKIDPQGAGHVYCPAGPAYWTAGDMDARNGLIWVGGGTDASKWSGYGAYSFQDDHWKSYNQKDFPQMKGFLNVFKISIDPLDDSHVVGGSYGYGIIDFNHNEVTAITDETNSILQPVPGYGHGYVNVTGVNIDAGGNLWVSTNFSNEPVYMRKPGGEWESVKLEYKYFGVEKRVGDILPTSQGQIWLILPYDGLIAFSADRENEVKERYFAVSNQVGDLLNRVYSIAEDKDGSIWVGTNKGPVIYSNPVDVYEGKLPVGYQPEIPRNDGTNYVDLLLSTEKINAIAVDGANRKWLATEKSGVFLVSPDGKKEIHHFTESNSPLFSDNVLTLTVNGKTGEVFFGTDKGILSYKGDATEGGDDFGHVYVYPNPVRETYDGDITVTGLASDVNVKITDISGNLVYETTALGGQAIWNGRNFSGERVHTGVYLVFCSNDDGSKTYVTKLLFIH